VTKRMMMASFALAAAVGCGGSEQQQAEDAAQQMQQGAEQVARAAEQMAQGSAEQMAQGLQQVTQGLQQMAQGQTEVVDYEVLKGLLPQVNGWTQAGVRGEQMSMPVKISRAEARYTRGDSSIELEIIDSAMSQLLLAPMSIYLSAGYSERSDEGFKRSAKIGDHPGIEDWNNGSRRGEVTAVVGNRFIVQATGRDIDDLAAVRQVVDAVDLTKLATLK
jgi:hypothetical protein